jgi:hypothetical protein
VVVIQVVVMKLQVMNKILNTGYIIYIVTKNWAAFPLFCKYEKFGKGGVLTLARRAQLTWSSVAPQLSSGGGLNPSMQPLQTAVCRVRTVRGCVCCQKRGIKRCSLHLPLAKHPPLLSCAPCAPLLSLWGGPEGQIIAFCDGGCGRGVRRAAWDS